MSDKENKTIVRGEKFTTVQDEGIIFGLANDLIDPSKTDEEVYKQIMEAMSYMAFRIVQRAIS